MGYELHIAKKLFFSQQGQKRISHSIVRLSIGGIALSLVVMIVAVAVVVGFKKEVRNKIIGFGSHLQVTASFSNQSYETLPLEFDSSLVRQLRVAPSVKHVQRFSTQPGILKVGDDFQGIVLKGVDQEYDWTFFQNNLKQGTFPVMIDSVNCNDILISQKVADMLHLSVGEKAFAYFIINEKVRVRPLTVCGIYATGFSDYDNLFVIGDMRHIRRLNQWEENQCSGLEIELNDFNQIDKATQNLYPYIGNRFDSKGNYYMLKNIKEINPQIFSWLDLLDMNVVIIFILMAAVAGFTMISGLLILILDRTNMIGLLKALGADNASVQRLFLYVALFIVGKGLLIGNIVGVLLCILQKKFGVVRLDPDIYYVESVPMDLVWWQVLAINLGVIALSFVVLRLSTYIITKITPIKSIRFE